MNDPTYLYEPDHRFDPKVVCELCGSRVEDEKQHTAWHRQIVEMIRYASAGRIT